VFILTKQMRQINDPCYAQLLSRLRTGDLSIYDLKTIRSRIIQNINLSNLFEYKVIVNQNNLREQINIKAIETFSFQFKIPRYIHDATDYFTKNPLNPLNFKNKNNKESSIYENLVQTTNKHLTKTLYLVKSANYIITTNIAIHLGLVNGTEINLQEIVLSDTSKIQPINELEYHLNDSPTYLVVKLNRHNQYKENIFMDFPQDTFPLQQISDYSSIKLSNGKYSQIKRTQFPLTLGYAITSWKAQGNTYKQIIVDLALPPNYSLDSNIPYTQLTRTQKLEYLHILRIYDDKVLLKKPNEDLVLEINRLEHLANLTKFKNFN
jgi:hypothetical protein